MSIEPFVKGLEKLTSMRLAEVLTQKGAVPAEAITDALYIQDKHGESFVDVMVDAGHIAEWDLARVVVENFQLPFVLAGSYQLSEEARDRVPAVDLFEHLLVPMDVFDDVLTVSMPVLTTAEVLIGLEKKHGIEIFPYVGLISENKKVFQDGFAGFKEWFKERQKEKERLSAEAKKKAQERVEEPEGKGEGDWGSLFDEADRSVQESIDKNRS